MGLVGRLLEPWLGCWVSRLGRGLTWGLGLSLGLASGCGRLVWLRWRMFRRRLGGGLGLWSGGGLLGGGGGQRRGLDLRPGLAGGFWVEGGWRRIQGGGRGMLVAVMMMMVVMMVLVRQPVLPFVAF